jgi:hypothetical protein
MQKTKTKPNPLLSLLAKVEGIRMEEQNPFLLHCYLINSAGLTLSIVTETIWENQTEKQSFFIFLDGENGREIVRRNPDEVLFTVECFAKLRAFSRKEQSIIQKLFSK